MNSLIFIMAERNMGTNIFRTVLSGLDQAFFWLFSLVMQAVFDIANLELVNDAAFATFQDRIYVILGIYMLFKVTISLLTYLVNPDAMMDKEKGMGKLVTRSIVVLCMLLLVPDAFKLLYRVQGPLLEAVPRVILGTSTSLNEAQGESQGISTEISKSLYSIVFQYAEGETDQNTAMGQFSSVAEAIDHINDPKDGDNSSYKYSYTPLLGIIIAAVMSLILIGICIDLAIRAFKLVILRMLAPIPIISYLDPKSSKDGAFSSWTKSIVSVWLELFLKVGVLFFVLSLIDLIILQDNVQWGSLMGMRKLMIQAVVIIGLLFFAKEAPEFVKKILGIKGDKSGGFFSGLGKIGAAAAIGAGVLGAGAASYKASRMADEVNGKKHNAGRFLKNFGAGVLGAGTGLAVGTSTALGAKDHARQKAIEAMNKRNANAIAMGAAGSTWWGRTKSGTTRFFTGDSSASKGKRHVAALEDFGKSLGAIDSRVKGEMVKQDWTVGELMERDGEKLSFNYKEFDANMQAAANSGASYFTMKDKITGKEHTISMVEAYQHKGTLQSNNENDYITKVLSKTEDCKDYNDGTLTTLIADAEAKSIVVEGANEAYYPGGKFKVSDRKSVKSTKEAIDNAITTEKRTNAKNEVNDQFSGKK